MILTRRQAFVLATAGLSTLSRLYGSDAFWNKKQPSDWTPEEVDRILTKSPWAKEVTANYAPGEGGNGGGGGYPGGGGTNRGPGGGIGGIGMPRRGGIGFPGGGVGFPGGGGGRGGGRRTGGGGSAYKGTVRWESAQPVLEAQKSQLPEIFKDHYAIAVSGIPLLTRRRADDDDNTSQKDKLDDAKAFTFLQPKGRELAQAGVAYQQPSSSHIFLFGFARDVLDLSADDKEVLFQTRLGGLRVKAKFDPKEMKYKGKLAL